MIGFKVEKSLKDFMQKLAREENRSLSNFILNGVLTYIKDHKGIDWHKETEEEKPDF